MSVNFFEAKGIFKNMGAGDALLKVSKIVGLSGAIEKMWGPDCGCEDRAKYLNKLMPRAAAYDITEEQAANILSIFKSIADQGGRLRRLEGEQLVRAHNSLFNKTSKFSTCTPCMKAIVKPLIVCLQANQYKVAGQNWTEIETPPEDTQEDNVIPVWEEVAVPPKTKTEKLENTLENESKKEPETIKSSRKKKGK